MMKIKFHIPKHLALIFGVLLVLSIFYGAFQTYRSVDIDAKNKLLLSQIDSLQKKLTDLETEDQFLKNKSLAEEIKNIEDTYNKAVEIYENLVDLRGVTTNTTKLDELFSSSLSILADHDFSKALEQLNQLNSDIASEKTKALAAQAAAALPVSAPVNNTPPGSGYSRQSVQSDAGNFVVSLVAGDMNSTKIIVDTASDSDCGNNCPVLPLATYAARNNAYAGINGTYFCPATYPTCSGKTNSFDLLVMNKNKTYFNSANNVYSNNPVVVFQPGSMRFIGSGSGWGRDTGPDSVLMNYPLLVNGGNVSFGGDDDPKKGSKGNRSFVANKGNTAYIGVVHNATVAETARVLKAMGMENALNLDSGGSTALWSGGYKLGPGRDLPNAILFVRK
jgi:exopolysaccharide biosynthesis protein